MINTTAKQQQSTCDGEVHERKDRHTQSLPASHVPESNSKKEEPCGQAQVYPPGRSRQRWLHIFLQGFGTGKKVSNTIRYWSELKSPLVDFDVLKRVIVVSDST